MDDLNRPGADDEPPPVQLRYEDAYAYQNIYGPLVNMEAEYDSTSAQALKLISYQLGRHFAHSPRYDKRVKEAQTQENITVRWDMGLNKRRIAWYTPANQPLSPPPRRLYFNFSQLSSSRLGSAQLDTLTKARSFRFTPTTGQEIRLVTGDELMLRYAGDLGHPSWECVAHVIRIHNEEVAAELRSNQGAPIDLTHNFTVTFVWKATSFDRMQVRLPLPSHTEPTWSD